LFIVHYLATSAFAQDNVQYITPSELKKNIDNSKKPTVLQFWIPNCANADEIITEYQRLEEKFGKEVNFYFIGITNKAALVNDLIRKGDYTHNIYIADTAIDKNINSRKETFCKVLNSFFNRKSPFDFITLFLDKNGKLFYAGDRLKLKDRQIKNLIRIS